MTLSGRLPLWRALVFDAYGTLFDVHSVVATCEQRFPGRGRELSGLWRAKQLEYSWLSSLMERYVDFWQVTERALEFACRAHDLPREAAVRGRLMDAYLALVPFPDVRPALARLSAFSLAVLSNGSPAMLHAVIERAGLGGTFAHVISVDEVQVYKPSPRVYQLACDRLGLSAREIGFVSSNPFDVSGAAAYGLWTCWVRRSDTVWDELGFAPDVTVASLEELALTLAR